MFLFDEWFEYFDDGSQNYYYYNTKTGETTWDKPTKSKPIPAIIPIKVEQEKIEEKVEEKVEEKEEKIEEKNENLVEKKEEEVITVNHTGKKIAPKYSVYNKATVEKIQDKRASQPVTREENKSKTETTKKLFNNPFTQEMEKKEELKPRSYSTIGPVKSDFGDKQGGAFKKWDNRYFVLYGNGILEYYSGLQSFKNTYTPNQLLDLSKGELKGRFNVKQCNFRFEKIKGHEYSIVIETEGRDFPISFKDEKTALEWKEAFLRIEMLNSILIEGYALKLGEKIKNWQKRYFILYNDLVIEYYNEDQLKGTIQIKGCKFKLFLGIQNCLQIELKTGRLFQISFREEIVMNEWRKLFIKNGLIDATENDSRVLYSQFIDKLGEKVKNWQNRFFVLYSNSNLEYYKGVPSNKEFKKGELKGTFTVKGTSFKVTKLNNDTYLMTIELKHRDFYLKFKDKYSIELFKSSLIQSGCKIIETQRKLETSIFGVDLDESMKKEKTYLIPEQIHILFDIIKKNGHLYEGIFRISIEKDALDGFIQRIDQGEIIDFTNEIKDDENLTHTCACILKRYIRELPNSLLTFELYDDFLKTTSMTNLNEKEELLLKYLKQIPQNSFELLRELFDLCSKIEANSAINKMNAHNLSVVFGIGILKHKDELKTTMDVSMIQKVFIFLLELYKKKLF